MKEKTRNSLENLSKAIGRLESFLSTPIVDDRDKAGVIQAFEFSFELAWKTIQKAVEEQGLSGGSPKQAFQAAFQVGWIKENEQTSWLEMLEDRNLMSHAYKEETANVVFTRVQTKHVKSLRTLLGRIQGHQ